MWILRETRKTSTVEAKQGMRDNKLPGTHFDSPETEAEARKASTVNQGKTSCKEGGFVRVDKREKGKPRQGGVHVCVC